MIDLTTMGGVSVDPVTRRARVQGGAMLGALDRAAQPFGLAATAGNVSHTGVDDDATGFSHRRTRFEYVAAAKWSDPGEDRQRMGAARREAAKLDPFAVGAYVNTLQSWGADLYRHTGHGER
jgi:FAD/FMN-containing dehydrogenase